MQKDVAQKPILRLQEFIRQQTIPIQFDMENRWKTIVRNLQKSKQKNVGEDTYQDTIECQLQLLGWFEGIETRPSIPNGASGILKPDIVLNKDGHRALPIEIKRPTNTINDRQVGQLSSYMRRLRLSFGLYIGENIQLYYDTPNDDNDAIPICKIEIEENSPMGIKLCQLLSYDNFDTNVIENFCKEQLRMINARNDFRKRIQEYVSPNYVVQNILDLLKEKFSGEGFDDAIINAELNKLNIIIEYRKQNNTENTAPTPKKNLKTSKSSQSGNTKVEDISLSSNKIFEIKILGGKILARAIYKDGKMIVLKGSTFSQGVASSFTSHKLRNEVIKKSTLLPTGVYSLIEDYSFNSPSEASKIICGYSTNGLICWKTCDGKTLKEVIGR